jgi:UDP-N-acetylmuramoyl-L-alanyl-D-glutamate--2,6-diaminopimelate ligase
MGAVASRFSDVVLITSDNPRGEDPRRIVEDIQRGLTADARPARTQRVLIILDRREAISKAVEMAQPGDLVLIAGKGHEKNQVIGDRVFDFDDVAVAREALDHRRGRRSVV